MSAGYTSLEQRSDFEGVPVRIFWVVVFILLPMLALLGGVAVLMMAVAFGVAAIVWQRPQETPGAGMLYLFACNVVFPTAARLEATQSTWEMYYWAIGLLIITAAGVTRIGFRRVFSVPLPAKVFLGVALAATVYGIVHGAETSYVVRQFYGILLLITYLGLALHAGNLSLLVRRIQTFGIICAFFFFVYFLAEFDQLGFHREMTTVGTQAAMLATVLFLFGLEQKKYAWMLGAFALLCVPGLIFQRRAVLTFVMALPVALAIRLKSKRLRLLCFVLIALLLLPGLLPPVAQWVGDVMESTPLIGNILPPGSQDSDTLVERTMQLAAAVETVQTQPLLGTGLGGTIQYTGPLYGFVEEAYVDSGWGYLLQKMGLLGAVSFLWLLFTLFRNSSRELLGVSACLMSISLMTMFSEPVFFHFTTAPFVGTLAGLLFAKRYQNEKYLKRVSLAAGPPGNVTVPSPAKGV